MKQIVLQVLEEREGKARSSDPIKRMPDQEGKLHKNILEDYDEDALNGILEAISAFKEQ